MVFYSVASPMAVRLEDVGEGRFYFYSTDVVESPLVIGMTKLGFSYMYAVDSRDAAVVRGLFEKIDGESMTIDGDKDFGEILRQLGARKIFEQKLGELETVYGYSPRIPTHIVENGRKVNVQIARRKSPTPTGQIVLTVGWPVILGGY